MYTLEQLQQKTLKELKEIGWQLNVLPSVDRRCRQNWIDTLIGVNPPLLELLETSRAADESVEGALEIQATEAIEYGRITGYLCRPKSIKIQATEPIAIFNDEQPPNRGDGRGGRVEQTPVTFSDRFLATYGPYFGEVPYKADATGQLNLLEPDIEDEPPDPDDFDSLDAFKKAIALWDSEHPEPPEVSLDSFREWAPCPEEWFIPDTNETNETVSCTLEIPPVSVFSSGADESSSTSNFSIPVFGVAGDRANRNEEPPTAGVGARLPRPKPPSFPPMGVIAGDRSSIEKFARRAILLSGRDPPGGDAAHSP